MIYLIIRYTLIIICLFYNLHKNFKKTSDQIWCFKVKNINFFLRRREQSSREITVLPIMARNGQYATTLTNDQGRIQDGRQGGLNNDEDVNLNQYLMVI